MSAAGEEPTVSDVARTETARGYLTRAGVMDRVELLEGAALAVLPTLEGPIDLAYGNLAMAFNQVMLGQLEESTQALEHLRTDMENKGMVERVVSDAKVSESISTPPQTTRARLRGSFIKAAKAKKRDFTVDWVHLKLNDQAQRTVMCKDPFKAHDERVEKLIESL